LNTNAPKVTKFKEILFCLKEKLGFLAISNNVPVDSFQKKIPLNYGFPHLLPILNYNGQA